MFTGLVESTGRLRAARRAGASRRFTIEAAFAPELVQGESVAVSGVCLSVEASDERSFEVTAVAETLARSTLGSARTGHRVNLERSLTLSDRLGGHLVTGHVDGTGRVRAHTRSAGGRLLAIDYPVEFDPWIVDKGSIALDGVSLTVVEAGRGRFTVALIPQTCAVTTLGGLTTGDRVNLEFDLVGKYLWRQGRLGSAWIREEAIRV
jgi:riboflavin synthase